MDNALWPMNNCLETGWEHRQYKALKNYDILGLMDL
jgi:hypothetical protein